MSLIYSLCVEKSRSRQHATFHLVQYRFILSGLRSARTWYDNWGGPTTVNAVWHKSFAGNDTRFPIAFGTTGIGQPKEKNEVAASRRDFMELLTKAFKTDAPPLGSRCLNPAGSCPEFLSWELVCRSSGEYETLCLSVSQGGKVTVDKLMKCCSHCERTRVHLQRNGMVINDLWEKSFLRNSSPIDGEQNSRIRIASW